MSVKYDASHNWFIKYFFFLNFIASGVTGAHRVFCLGSILIWRDAKWWVAQTSFHLEWLKQDQKDKIYIFHLWGTPVQTLHLFILLQPPLLPHLNACRNRHGVLDRGGVPDHPAATVLQTRPSPKSLTWTLQDKMQCGRSRLARRRWVHLSAASSNQSVLGGGCSAREQTSVSPCCSRSFLTDFISRHTREQSHACFRHLFVSLRDQTQPVILQNLPPPHRRNTKQIRVALTSSLMIKDVSIVWRDRLVPGGEHDYKF